MLKILAFFLLAVVNTPAQTEGIIIAVKDGDTAVLLTRSRTEVIIRLSGIDAPEKSQAYGDKAKRFLAGMIFGKIVSVESEGQDRYGRTIGTIYNAYGDNINYEMVKSGYAWWYQKYSDDVNLEAYEREARKMKAGLWEDKYPVPPWDYRKGNRGNAAVVSAPRCKAITQKGTRCKRKADDSGYCWQHKR